MRSLIYLIGVFILVQACKQRRPEAATGLLDRDSEEILVACESESKEQWRLGLAGWNPVASEGQTAWVRIAKGETSFVDEAAVVHYEPEKHLTVIYQSGALQMEASPAGTFIGILDVKDRVLEEVSCQYQ